MKILFVVKEFLPKPTPPGLCILNLQKALFDKGIRSDVLMVGSEECHYRTTEIGDVYSIKSGINFEKKKENIINYLRIHIPMLFTWPVPSIKRVNDYRRVIRKLNNENNYDAIIGTMFPPDVCVACSVFDHFFYYELDSLINNPMNQEGAKKYLTLRLRRLEKKLFDRAELIIHLNNNRQFYSQKKYGRYLCKSVFTDIPNLIEEKLDDKDMLVQHFSLEITENQLLMVYSGLLSKYYRSPSKLIELIKEISKVLNIKCLFFTRGDCEDELRIAEAATNGMIKRMGYVSQEELNIYTNRADFLLDIGNHLSGEDYSLPSKIISYMATGKPIIHMNGVNDSAIKYLDKYGLAINISENASKKEAQQAVLNFIENNKGKRIPFEEVAEKFPQNLPDYTADLIIEHIKNRKNLGI